MDVVAVTRESISLNGMKGKQASVLFCLFIILDLENVDL
jgi:hypothetical protein